ncbi:MAG: hypothetical protein OEX19_13440 [Gammaproteobacteria bacterium]|nr:hypothetical protein [Gammaproteobacteria bacterium]
MIRNIFFMPLILLFTLSPCWAGNVVAEDVLVVEETGADAKMENKRNVPDLDLTPRLPVADNNMSKLIMVPPGTERVLIQQSNYEFQEEAKSFRRFRWHYMAYFSLWFTMMVTNVSWEE